MPILKGDIKLLASQVMDDVPEGGGAPTATVIVDGASNSVFKDISEADRSGGKVNMRKLHVGVLTADTDTYLGPNIIVAEPPADPNVSVTLFSTRDTFDRREAAKNRIESYLIEGPEWGGYLLENHVAGQRSIQLFQRPGGAPPNIGRTLVLILNEGLALERKQFVRITAVETAQRTFTFNSGGGFVDFAAEVLTCDLSDALRFAFLGSPPDRGFARQSNKTLLRDTTVADAANYFGVVPLQIAAALGDSGAKATSVYTQLVPSARTESIALDQRPAAVRQIELAASPRRITIAAAPNTMRIRIGQENRGNSYTQILVPAPAQNTVVVSYRALGTWYTVQDDGLGVLSGSGVGTVNYANGTIAITLPVLPDAGSSIIFSWGQKIAYTDRNGQAGFREPEFAFALTKQGLKPGTVVVTWLSGGVLRTATDNGLGALAGAATGEVNYAGGKVMIRPNLMLDAGGQFNIAFEWANTITKNVTGAVVDAGGFATIVLDDVPAMGSINVSWITVRNVSISAGATTGDVQKASSYSTGLKPQTDGVRGVSYSSGNPLAPPALGTDKGPRLAGFNW